MKYRYYLFFLFSSFSFFYSLFSLIPFIGNSRPGFSFNILPQIRVDYFNQFIFLVSSEEINQNNLSLSFSISVYDIKNNNSRNNSYQFIPIITKNALLNGVLETNPLYENGFNYFDLLLGLEFEPKFYPICNPINNSQIYIINNLELYNNDRNKIISTEPLLDTSLNVGQINGLAPLQNKFLATVITKGSIFDGINSICNCYDYQVKEKIMQMPGNSHYVTFLQLSNPNITQFSAESKSLLINGETSVNLIADNFILYANQTINKAYIGVSGKGLTGIKTVCMNNEPILPVFSESALDGNNIVATNQVSTNLYNKGLSSLYTSTKLNYLVVLGGTNDLNTSLSTVYALPLINSNEDTSLIGTLASVNQNPIPIFNMVSPFEFIGNILDLSPFLPGDLYSTTSPEALVGRGSLIINNGISDYQLKINSIEGYKDTVFVSATYINNDKNCTGGVFYSQALFNEYGAIKNWTKWQRKSFCGDVITQAYVPTLGVNIGVYGILPKQVVIPQFSSSGPFLTYLNSNYTSLPCDKTGIEKIIDIPYTHPGIGINKTSIVNLYPSYLIAVGYNTVILQQTAKNNSLYPLLQGEVVNCINGNTSNIIEKNESTNIITFQGGVLNDSGALFTAALAYSDSDCWLVIAGSKGVFILSNPINGNGCGPDLLQDNFIGINNSLVWQSLGNFNTVKKIVSNKDYLYVMTNQSIYRILINSNNIMASKQCDYVTLLNNFNLPNATPYSSFSDILCSENVILIASSMGLFTNSLGSSIKNGEIISLKKIELPESFGVVPLSFCSNTIDGNADSWGSSDDKTITSNIYVMATSISHHYSKVYRLITYGNINSKKETIFLLPNYFIKDFQSYYYNPNIELLSIASDGASLFTHGVYGNSILYRSFIGILNPFVRHGSLALKNEYNFFELSSKTNSYFGYPTFISGIGIWLFSSQNGIQGLC